MNRSILVIHNSHTGFTQRYAELIGNALDCPVCALKKLVVFATGTMPNEAEAQIQAMWEQNLTRSEQKTIPHFYLQAGLCYEKMGGVDRAMMKFAAWAMSRKKAKTAEDEAFQNAIRQSYDISDPKYIQPLVSRLKQGN